MKPTNPHQRLRKAIGLGAFLCLAIVLLAAITYVVMIRQSNAHEIAKLESTRDSLQVIADRLETEANQAENGKRVVLSLFRHCRTAKDIPDLQSNRIVARRQSFERLCIYVPEGSHTLEIKSTWKPTSTQDPSTEEDVPADAGAGKKTWNLPLLPACGYCLKLSADRKGGPIQWELTSNHPEFKTQTGTVPLDGFSHRGSSWSGSEDVVQFPNQIERLSIGELKTTAKPRLGINLMNTTLRGPRDDQQYEVSLTVRLLSDGPACVSASEAQRIIILGQENLLLPYEGGGKYDIGVSDTTKLAPK